MFTLLRKLFTEPTTKSPVTKRATTRQASLRLESLEGRDCPSTLTSRGQLPPGPIAPLTSEAQQPPAYVSPMGPYQEAKMVTRNGLQIPTSAIYQVTISGVASGWSFTRTAYLAVSQTVDTVNASGTGLNPREFTLLSGNPISSPSRGAIQFSTNTGVLGARARLDVAYVSANTRTGAVSINLAPNVSRGSSFELFNVNSGLTANVYFISSGRMNLQFSNNGQRVSGTAAFLGNGALFGTASYAIQISGVRIR